METCNFLNLLSMMEEAQREELKALESIYSGSELKVCSRDYPCICVQVTAEIYSTSDSQSVTLQCTLPTDYPNVIPVIELKNLPDDWNDLLPGLHVELRKVAEENVGMPMIFTLVAALQDYITGQLENVKKSVDRAEEQRKLQAELLERAKFEDSRLTVEQFNEWLEKFMKEVQSQREMEQKTVEQADRPTGKQLFLRDKSLNISDLQFINDATAGAIVDDIDASLFENEIDDVTDEDDESYVCPDE